ncbi:MAG TPA: protein arginine kinase, partial [Nonomuraea sp.]|nr:protein arginine kinase [Nonomuraea sp.]
FLTKATINQRRELLNMCRTRIVEAGLAPKLHWLDLTDAQGTDRQLLVERHLISRQHAQGKSARGVAISDDEGIAIMVNEEDHVRLQVLRSGFQCEEAYARADRVDDALERKLDFAFSSTLGYLTACPTNVGTGIRVSVMLHLPALKMTGEIDKLRRAAKDMHLAVRGFHGEGTEAVGDLYQVSNQTTLGRSETQILADFGEVIIPKVIEYERKAREALSADRSSVLDDKAWRAWGTLCHARLLGSEEAMSLLSLVRLGIAMKRIDVPGVTAATINEMMILTQPAHLQKMAGQTLDGPQRRRARAEFVRNRLTTRPAGRPELQ